MRNYVTQAEEKKRTIIAMAIFYVIAITAVVITFFAI